MFGILCLLFNILFFAAFDQIENVLLHIKTICCNEINRRTCSYWEKPSSLLNFVNKLFTGKVRILLSLYYVRQLFNVYSQYPTTVKCVTKTPATIISGSKNVRKLFIIKNAAAKSYNCINLHMKVNVRQARDVHPKCTSRR